MRIVLNYSFGFGQYWDFNESLWYKSLKSWRYCFVELGAPIAGGSNLYDYVGDEESEDN